MSAPVTSPGEFPGVTLLPWEMLFAKDSVAMQVSPPLGDRVDLEGLVLGMGTPAPL